VTLNYDATKREFVGAVRFADGDREVRIPLAQLEQAMMAVPKVWFRQSAIEEAREQRNLQRLRDLDNQAYSLEGVDELTVDVLTAWLRDRRDFAVKLASRVTESVTVKQPVTPEGV
jgi:hypothetical protein